MPTFSHDVKILFGVLCMFLSVASSHATLHIATKSLANTLSGSDMTAYFEGPDLCALALLLWLHQASPVAGRISLFIVIVFLPGATAVCKTCWGAGIGCKVGIDEHAVCPWASQMTENTKAIAAAVGGALVVGSLLTPRLLRVFTKPVLDTLAMVVARPTGGQPYDLITKNPHQIQKAVSARYVSKAEAIMELTSRLYAPELEISASDTAGVLEEKKSKRDNIKTAIAATGAPGGRPNSPVTHARLFSSCIR